MPQKKKQHYVPKLYMKRFSNNQGLLCLLNLKNMNIVENISYEGQCYKDYFYGKNNIWEDKLSQMETVWDNVIKKITDSDEYCLSNDDEESIKKFALFQRQRTYAENEHRKAQRKELLEVHAKMIFSQKGWNYSQNIQTWISEKVENEALPEENLMISEKIEPCISDLHVKIIHYKTKSDLVFSDMPVIMINPFHCFTIGFGVIGIVIFFPVSSHKLVVIYDSIMFNSKGRNYIISYDENEVLELNAYQYVSAQKIVLARRKTELENLISQSEKFNKDRDNSINRSVPVALGSSDNKLISASMRLTLRKEKLSFCKLPKYVERIKFIGREAVLRKYDKGWENKLETKESLLPFLYEKHTEECKEGKLTKTEVQNACREMTRYAKYYWGLSSHIE